MTTQEVANRLVELCRTGQYETAMAELYGTNIKSVEPEGAFYPTVEGLDAVIEKGKKCQEGVEEVHGGTVSDPLVAGPYFTIAMGMDITLKGMGRMQMEEICVYKVEDGKIVYEEFLYPTQG